MILRHMYPYVGETYRQIFRISKDDLTIAVSVPIPTVP